MRPWVSSVILSVLLSGVLAADAGFAVFQTKQMRDPMVSGFDRFVRGNEQLGRKLLRYVHTASPARNVTVAPASLTVVLSAIQNSAAYDISKEIGDAFGWGTAISGHLIDLKSPARMLLASFSTSGYPPEGTWITNRVVYRTPPAVNAQSSASPLSREFRDAGEKFFGLTFESSGAARPAANEPSTSVAMPNDLVVVSSVHLLTAWQGNTFSRSKSFTAGFRTADGTERRVPMLTSELDSYSHAITADFEAAALPCNRGYMIVVLPAEGRSVESVVRILEKDPGALDAALKMEIGDVTMPVFHTVFESDLKPALESLGVHAVFKDLKGVVDIPNSRLSELRQSVDIEVNQQGIRAAATTTFGAIYGGALGGPFQPFHLKLDRPFIYLIRDISAGVLLFAGIVNDPSVK